MDNKANSALTVAYVLVLTTACIVAVAYTWKKTIVNHDFEIVIPEEGIESVDTE